MDSEQATLDRIVDALKNCWTVEDIKGLISRFQLDLRREPAYSQMIFSRMLSQSVYSKHPDVGELFTFLDDPSLNTQDSGNYLSLVEHLMLNETSAHMRVQFLRMINRALELGLISSGEIGLIVRALPDIRLHGTTNREYPGDLARCYREMWEALRACSVLRPKDLREDVLEPWLDHLTLSQPHRGILLLAKDIIVATYDSDSPACRWIPGLILQRISLSINSVSDESSLSLQKYNVDYLYDILSPLSADLAVGYIIQVSEMLAFSMQGDAYQLSMLSAWRDCLSRIPNAISLVHSSAWTVASVSAVSHMSGFSTRHRVLLRLWVLKCLRDSLHEGPAWKQYPKATDSIIFSLLNQFDSLTSGRNEAVFLTNLIEGLQDLNLPYIGILMMAIDIKTKQKTSRSAKRILEQLETSQTTLADVAICLNSYNATKQHFFPTFESMVRRIDITTSDFVENSIRLAEGGGKGSADLLRLLRAHTPLKTALAMSWQSSSTDPTLESFVPYQSRDVSTRYPDPQICLQLIHLLAIVFSSSTKLTPPRAYRTVHWLYVFLRRHNAPVKPSMIRALYHCGVVRYRREGRPVSQKKYQYILGLIRRFEGPEVVKMFETACC
jgi:hypothetical protein